MAVSRDIDCRFLVLRDWVDIDKLDIISLCSNLNAIEYMNDELICLDLCSSLCINSNAITLINKCKQYSSLIDWKKLSQNENATDLLLKNEDKIDMRYVIYNKNLIYLYENSKKIRKNISIKQCISLSLRNKDNNVIKFIDKHIKYIKNMSEFDIYMFICDLASCNDEKFIIIYEKYFKNDIIKEYNGKNYIEHISNFVTNPCAISLIEKHPEQIPENIFNMSRNSNAIHILEKYQKNVNPDWISENKNAIKLIKNNTDLLVMNKLAKNTNYKAMELIEKNLREYLDSCDIEEYNDFKCNLSMNPNATEILKKNQELIDWHSFSKNPTIFTYNYIEIQQIKKNINEGIIEWTWKSEHMNKWKAWRLG